MVISLGIALILNNKVHLKGLIRLLFFIPYVSSLIAVSVIFMAFYHPALGPINQFMFSIGIENPPKWLADPDWALFSIMLMVIWKGLGFNLIV